jgi:hypothetical protein
MIAVKRLQSLFWVLLVALGALGAYLVSLRVATERNDLMHVRAQIARARADIRYLETEFSARANMRQLEAWNAEDFRYSALPAEHYLHGERELAQLDGMEPNGPAYIAQPVMVAMVDKEAAPQAEPVASPATMQVGLDISAPAAETAPARKAIFLASMNEKAIPEKSAPRPDDAGRSKADKAKRVAMLDARLLDERTLGEIGIRADVENRGGKR